MDLVVSDDASVDGTFGIVQRELERYRGPHRVELRRRRENSGSKTAHLNEVLPQVSGDVIVSFDDDDVSEPSRVTRIVDAFGPGVQAVYSSYSLIDEDGRPFGRARIPRPGSGDDAKAWFAKVDAYAAGTTLAIRRSVVSTFGAMDPEVHEDIILPFRASLLGEVRFIDEPLVKARRRAGSLTADMDRFESIEKYRASLESGIEQARRNSTSRLTDLRTAGRMMPDRSEELGALREVVFASLGQAERTAKLMSPSLPTRLSTLVELLRAGAYRDELAQHACLALLPGTYLRYKRRVLGGLQRRTLR